MRRMLKSDIPPETYIREIFEELSTDIERRIESCFMTRIKEIEHESRDGFIPFTNGGLEGTAYCSMRQGQYDFKCLKEYEENDYKDMLEGFREWITSQNVELPENYEEMTDQA